MAKIEPINEEDVVSHFKEFVDLDFGEVVASGIEKEFMWIVKRVDSRVSSTWIFGGSGSYYLGYILTPTDDFNADLVDVAPELQGVTYHQHHNGLICLGLDTANDFFSAGMENTEEGVIRETKALGEAAIKWMTHGETGF